MNTKTIELTNAIETPGSGWDWLFYFRFVGRVVKTCLIIAAVCLTIELGKVGYAYGSYQYAKTELALKAYALDWAMSSFDEGQFETELDRKGNLVLVKGKDLTTQQLRTALVHYRTKAEMEAAQFRDVVQYIGTMVIERSPAERSPAQGDE